MFVIDMKIVDLSEIATELANRIINEIDPALSQFVNISTELFSLLETRIKQNGSEAFNYLATNLFFLLFGIILFIILLLTMFWMLENVMKNFGFALETRKFVGLALLTFISVWSFLAVLRLNFLPEQAIDLQTLKYILFGITSLGVVLMMFIWVRWIFMHSTGIKRFFVNELFDFKQPPMQPNPIHLQ